MNNTNENTFYKKYFRTVLAGLFVILLSVFSFNFVLDPYNRNRVFDLGLPKATISNKMHYPLYKSLEYSQNPKPILLLGDSRTDALKPRFFAEAGRNDVYNMAYGGGTLYEAIDSFWYATETSKLDRVVIGLPFNLYNASNNLNRFTEAVRLSRSVPAYYLSPFVARTGFLNTASKLSGEDLKSEKPKMSRDRFWQQQLGTVTSGYYGNWREPGDLLQALREIASYCETNQIELVFFIPPTHTDLQVKLDEFELRGAYEKFTGSLAQLGAVIDFDFPNALTSDALRFNDPYHFNESVTPLIVRALLKPLNSLESNEIYHVNGITGR